MIPVIPAPEPCAPDFDFQREVYERGEDTIRQLAGLPPLRTWRGRKVKARVRRLEEVTHAMLRAHDHWTRALPSLHRAYRGYCAYTARFIEPIELPTTDHFVALRSSVDPLMAYTWSNYRLAHAFVNGAKTDSDEVLDPFEIQQGWFALDLGTFKTVVGPEASAAQRPAIQRTITLLKLDGAELAETRRRAANRYWAPPPGQPRLPLWHLEEDEPFLALELRRQRRLHPEDE